jgi:hypothetical protein
MVYEYPTDLGQNILHMLVKYIWCMVQFNSGVYDFLDDLSIDESGILTLSNIIILDLTVPLCPVVFVL